jgi:hypothetical protein
MRVWTNQMLIGRSSTDRCTGSTVHIGKVTSAYCNLRGCYRSISQRSAKILALLGRPRRWRGRARVCRSNAPGSRVPPSHSAVRGGSSSPACPSWSPWRPWRKLDANQSPRTARGATWIFVNPERSTTPKRLDRFATYPLSLRARFLPVGRTGRRVGPPRPEAVIGYRFDSSVSSILDSRFSVHGSRVSVHGSASRVIGHFSLSASQLFSF